MSCPKEIRAEKEGSDSFHDCSCMPCAYKLGSNEARGLQGGDVNRNKWSSELRKTRGAEEEGEPRVVRVNEAEGRRHLERGDAWRKMQREWVAGLREPWRETGVQSVISQRLFRHLALPVCRHICLHCGF